MLRSSPRSGRRAATATETLLILGCVAIALLAGVTAYGHRIATLFAGSTSRLDHGASEAPQVADLGNAPAGDFDLPNGAGGSGPDLSQVRLGQVAGGPKPLPKARDKDLVYFGTDPVDKWNPSRMLDKMTQFDQNSRTNFDGWRCAQASALAQRIMNGPGAVRDLLRALEQVALGNTAPNHQDFGNGIHMIGDFTVSQFMTEIDKITTHLDKDKLTYGDLGMLQELMYQAYGDTSLGSNGSVMPNSPGTAVTTVPGQGSIPQLVGLGDGMDPDGNSVGSPPAANNNTTIAPVEGLKDELTMLPPGYSFIVGIDTGPPAGGDHAIVMGKDEEGSIYLYNPWPDSMVGNKRSPNIVYLEVDPDLFNDYLTKFEPPGGFVRMSPVKY